MSVRCTICDNPVRAQIVNPLLDQKMTSVGIERYAAEAGIKITADVINRHKKHYKAEYVRPPGTSKRDAAIIIKNRVLDALERVEDRPGQWIGEGEDRTWVPGSSILDKDLQPALRTALDAQKTEDAREKAKQGKGTAELAFAIIAMLEGRPPMLALDDGMTIDGEAVEVDGPPL